MLQQDVCVPEELHTELTLEGPIFRVHRDVEAHLLDGGEGGLAHVAHKALAKGLLPGGFLGIRGLLQRRNRRCGSESRGMRDNISWLLYVFTFFFDCN